MSFAEQRRSMIERQVARRGVTDPRVLQALREVPREAFVDPELREFAYQDTPLPIAAGQTISQPYIVAVTAEALQLRGDERVLEVGAGSGYAAAVLSRMVKEIYTIERHALLAETAQKRLRELGFTNAVVLQGDGTLGWPEHAPYDAIAVAAAAPEVPRALLEQLGAGGRMVIPIGSQGAGQVLLRITREAGGFREEALTGVRFVPLIGEQGFPDEDRDPDPNSTHVAMAKPGRPATAARLIAEVAEPISGVDSTSPALDALIERIADARVVLLGEATHGTSEFYRMRATISRALIERKGFNFVAVEADWPDAARIDDYVLDRPRRSGRDFVAFSRFPTWMWRNREVEQFARWLREHDARIAERSRKVGFHGLDLYSLFSSIDAVLSYLDDVDAASARIARARYGRLTPWQKDPTAYGLAVLSGKYESSEQEVVSMLTDLLARRLDYSKNDGDRFFDAAQNARVVANAERYYRSMYYGSAASWNLRDSHMFDTLESLLAYYGPDSRGVVWAHNSHVGNAAATDMGSRQQLNVGQLCRERFGEAAYLVGFGTHHGKVAAASDWGGPMQIMDVRPSHGDSYERLCHESAVPGFTLHLRDPRRRVVRDELEPERLQRAIGVIYRPETELASHYLYASLPRQFDEYLWFDETSPITAHPTEMVQTADAPETYPFGL